MAEDDAAFQRQLAALNAAVKKIPVNNSQRLERYYRAGATLWLTVGVC